MSTVAQVRENVRQTFKRILPKYTFSKRIAKELPEEVILHTKAIELSRISEVTSDNTEEYLRHYSNLFLEVVSMLEAGIADPFELIASGQNGWGSVLFKQHVEQERKDIINLQRPLDVEDGLYECPKCKGKKTHHYSRQMRSADEPMTTVITCANTDCQYRWKIN